MPEKSEACGRCTMTTVVDSASDGDGSRNPFDGDRIEVAEDEMRAVARPQIAAGRIKQRIDEWAARFVHGR